MQFQYIINNLYKRAIKNTLRHEYTKNQHIY